MDVFRLPQNVLQLVMNNPFNRRHHPNIFKHAFYLSGERRQALAFGDDKPETNLVVTGMGFFTAAVCRARASCPPEP